MWYSSPIFNCHHKQQGIILQYAKRHHSIWYALSCRIFILIILIPGYVSTLKSTIRNSTKILNIMCKSDEVPHSIFCGFTWVVFPHWSYISNYFKSASIPSRKPQQQDTNLLMIASTMTWIGFWSLRRWMISIACLIILTAMSFFPLFLPCIMRELVSLQFTCLLEQ